MQHQGGVALAHQVEGKSKGTSFCPNVHGWQCLRHDTSVMCVLTKGHSGYIRCVFAPKEILTSERFRLTCSGWLCRSTKKLYNYVDKLAQLALYVNELTGGIPHKN